MSDGRGATLAVAGTLAFFFATRQKVVLRSGGGHGLAELRLDELTLVLCLALHLSRRHRFSSGFRRPLLGQGEVRIRIGLANAPMEV